MYYYIVDPPQTKTDQQIVNSIRKLVVTEGIAGEFVFRTPGQSASHLAEKALKQGFSTVVSVGEDTLAGELASVLYDQSCALGIIPIHASDALHNIIGYSDWRAGLSALRARKLALRDIGVINGEFSFLTEVVLRSPKPTIFHAHMNRFTANIESDSLILRLSNDIVPFDVPGVINFVVLQKPRGHGFFGLGGTRDAEISTLIRSEQGVVQTDAPVAVYYADKSITQTPLSVSIIPQTIRMIVARKERI